MSHHTQQHMMNKSNEQTQTHEQRSRNVYRPPNHCVINDIRNIFDISKDNLLGQGVSGKVYKTCLKNGIISPNPNVSHNTYYALKCMDKSVNWIEKSFCRESHNMMALCSVPGIINVIGTFEDNQYFCILTELATSDAFTMVKQSGCGRLDENYVKHCMYQLLKSIYWLHSMNYVHRDIKPENIVLTQTTIENRQCCNDNNNNNECICNGTQKITKLEFTQPKLIDLADCGAIDDKAMYNKLVGTMCYLAPERLRAHYGYELKKADIWAIGVSCYEMLSGKRCFFGVNNEQLFERIKKALWVWPEGLNISENAKDFVKTLLEPNIKTRPSAGRALLHPWFSDILALEMSQNGSTNSEEYINISPLFKKSIEIIDCSKHFQNKYLFQQLQFQQQQQQQQNQYSMQLPNLYIQQSNSTSNINCQSNLSSASNYFVNGGNSNSNTNLNDQISPSASVFSRSFSPISGCPETPSAQSTNNNISVFSNFGNNSNGNSNNNNNYSMNMNMNSIPKFVPTPHCQQQCQNSSPIPQSPNNNNNYMQWSNANFNNSNNAPLRAFV